MIIKNRGGSGCKPASSRCLLQVLVVGGHTSSCLLLCKVIDDDGR